MINTYGHPLGAMNEAPNGTTNKQLLAKVQVDVDGARTWNGS